MSKDLPFTEVRPWGEFREFAHNEPVTVKIISVKQGGILSLQKHKKRDEFWKITKGAPEVTIGETVVKAKMGDEFTIKAGSLHRISAPDDAVEFLEVSRGDFDENDIVRFEDKYGRA